MGEMRGFVYVLLVTVFLAISWLIRILVSGKIHKNVRGKHGENRPPES
jgi:hypothetical protein